MSYLDSDNEQSKDFRARLADDSSVPQKHKTQFDKIWEVKNLAKKEWNEELFGKFLSNADYEADI